MKKIFLFVGFIISTVCVAQNREIKTYSGSLPKVVGYDNAKFPHNSEVYSYYLDTEGNKVRHGAYKNKGWYGDNDNPSLYTIVTAEYVDGKLNGQVKIDQYYSGADHKTVRTMDFKNGIPNGIWTYKDHYSNEADINISIHINNGQITKYNFVWINQLEKSKSTASGSYVNGEMEGIWNSFQIWAIHSNDNSYNLHNGVLITSPIEKSYSDGQITLEQLENNGYFQLYDKNTIRDNFDGIKMLDYCISEFKENEDNLLVLGETILFPEYRLPKVFVKCEIMDDDMFESFLHETKVKNTTNPELVNNPYGITNWGFSDRIQTYYAETKTHPVYCLTHKQCEIFKPLLTAVEERQANEQKEKERIAKEQEQLETERLIKSTINHIKELMDNTSKFNLKVYGADICIAVDYDNNRKIYDKGFFTNDRSRLGDVIGKALKAFVPFEEYTIESINDKSVVLIFNVVENKKSKIEYRIEVSHKNGSLCINDFDISKATIL
ncbi:MAG: hypothetical protein PUC96_03715 [Bacteroidales bacterium]|nr:hypothetical protein [Bacteroidales bacterium]